MDSKTKILVSLLDDALKIAEDRLLRREGGEHDPAPVSGLESIVANLQKRKESAIEGTLEPSHGFHTVGLNRELLDWGERSTPLFNALESLEEFYRDNF